MTQKTDNIWISLIVAFYRFVLSVGNSLSGLIRGHQRRENQVTDYQNLNDSIKKIPSLWAQHPTGIGMGRSIIVTILYFFRKHVYFNEKK